jgi:Uncharacterized enzyme involved in inositol metabolism
MSDNEKYLIKAGETAHGPFETDLTTSRAGWEFSSIRVFALSPGERVVVPGAEAEYLVLPLAGSCVVEVCGNEYTIEGRESIWTDITDYMYIPRNTDATIVSAEGGRFALPGAVASKDLPVTYCDRSQVQTGLRGAGPSSRQVNNYALGNEVETSHLLACEVLTPGGNWSSYPPHKHDEHNDVERKLEEIYFYQVRPGNGLDDGFAFQRIYTSSAGEMDFCAEVHDGDVVVMPFGYHGPAAAAPGYDLYYLNVMAGPSEDAVWLMTDDPKYAWIRDSWNEQEIDPRLPMTPMNI